MQRLSVRNPAHLTTPEVLKQSWAIGFYAQYADVWQTRLDLQCDG